MLLSNFTDPIVPANPLGIGETHPGEPKTYIPELDGLRAVAVCAVLLFHTIPGAIGGGFIGVDIFFVLSGYLITTILVREFDRKARIRLRNFYARRAIRLMPAFFALLAIYMLLVLIAKVIFERSAFFHEQSLAVLSSLFYFMNWTRALSLGPEGFLSHTWSLAIEEQFYIIWPLTLLGILFYFGRSSAWKPVLVILLVAMAWRMVLVFEGASPERIYNGFDTRAETLLFGCLLALAPLGSFQSFASRFWIVPAAVLIVISLRISWNSYLFQQFGFSVVGLCSAWLILAAMNGKPENLLRSVLRWSPLNYCGRISYGLYLWHYPIACVVAIYLAGGQFSGPKTLAITAVVTLLVASVSYHWLEFPILSLRGKFR